MTYDIGTARGVIQMDYNGRGVTQALTGLTGLERQGAAVDKSLRLATMAVAGMGLTIAGAFAFAVKKTADFEHRISAISAVSGAVGDELDAIREKALQLGADTVFSASEAAEAMEELVKAGLSVDDVLNGAADAAVALAAAGGIGIPEAATIASNAMNQFNLTASELPGVVDSIAGAANASAIDVGQLGTSLSQVGAVANLAGLSFEDTATAIALMGNAGIVGSDAGTSLKTMLQNLQPVTTKQKNLFKELGIVTEDGANAFFDAEGNVKSYAGISGVLSDALRGQTNQQKLMTLETMFGTDAIRAAAVAADAGAKGVRELNREMGETTAAEVAAKRMDNFKGSLEQLWGSIETAVITGGSGLLPYLRDVVDWLTEMVNSGTDVGGVLSEKLGPGFESVFDAISNVLEVAFNMIDAVDGIVMAFAALGLDAVIGAFTTVAGLIEFVTGLLEGQEAAIAIVVGTWLLLANGGIAVVAARLGWFAAYAVVQALAGLTALSGGAVAASAALKTLAAAAVTASASLAAVALLVAAVMVWQDYKKAVEETEEALASASKVKATGNNSALAAEIDSLKALIDERKALIEEYRVNDGGDVGKFFNNTFNPTRWGDVASLDEWEDSIGELQGSMSDLDMVMLSMGDGIATVAESLGMLEPDEAERLMEAFLDGDPVALEKMDQLLTDMQPLLDEAGVSAEEFMSALKGDGGNWMEEAFGTGPRTLNEIQVALDGVTGRANATKSATESLADAASDFGDEAMSASEKADALKTSLDALIGVELNADQAAIAWRDGLRALTEQIESTNGAINGGTEAADANRTAIIGSTEDILNRVEAEAKAGTSIGKITNMFRDQRRELINTAVDAGVNRKAMVALLETYNFTPEAVKTLVEAVGIERAQNQQEELIAKYKLTPDEVKTIFEAAGADTAAEKVKALRNHIKELKGKDAPIAVPGTPEAERQVKELEQAIKDLKGKDAPINTPGAAWARDEVARLRAEIERLRDKTVTITYVTRKVGGGLGPVGGDGVGAPPGSGGDPNDRPIVPRGMLPGSAPTTPSAPATGTLPAPRPSSEGGGRGRLRLLDGELRLDESGRAFITGVASEADVDDDDYADTLGRMN
jgi:TP901 family phage tail tape measure protein